MTRRRHQLLIVASIALTAIAWWLGGPVAPTAAQSVPPLTTRTNPNRVGINNANPAFTLDVNGTVNASAFRGDGSQLTGLAGISGSGTAHHLAKFTGATTLGSSALVEVNGNLGIGTTNPNTAPISIVKTGQPSSADTGGGAIQLGVAPMPVGGDRNSWVQVINGALLLQPIGSSVGIGYSLDSYLPGHGAKLAVNGTISGTAKNFVIDHPTRPGASLVHSSLEGPEVAVYYRGVARLHEGETVVTLPAYFEALTRKEQRTVHLTPVDDWSPLYVAADVHEGRFTVRAPAGGNPAQRFYWEVKAIRSDVAPLVVEPPRASR